MSPTTRTLEAPRLRPGGGSAMPPRHGNGEGPHGHPHGDGTAALPANTAAIAVWLLVAAVVILFASFTSTLVVRRAEADWRLGPRPAILWVNTAVLLASSAALEWARARGRAGRLAQLRAGLAAASGLGAAFLLGQWVAWRQVLGAGIVMATGPHSAFFYLLSGTHALHVAGGVATLLYALWCARRFSRADEAPPVLAPVAIYWHFVDVLWVYVFVLLFLR
jgi:cytochrome c oxidase subunit 3